MNEKINVLLIEDSENDAILIKRELKKGGFNPNIKRIETANDMKKSLKEKQWDIVISDYVLPNFNGLAALDVLNDLKKDIPFIIVSGKIGEDTAVEAMKKGANDYIMKDKIKKLTPALKRELQDFKNRQERKKAKEEAEKYHHELEKKNKQLKKEIKDRKSAEKSAIEAKEYLKNVIDSTSQFIIAVNNNNRITIWNEGAEQITGYKEKDVFNRTISKLDIFSDSQKIEDSIKDISDGHATKLNSVVISTKDNTKKILYLKGYLLKGQHRKKMGVIFIGEDITRDADMHGKLLEGNSYLLTDKHIDSSIDLFTDLVNMNHQGLMITRLNPAVIDNTLPHKENIEIKLIFEEKIDTYQNIIDLKNLTKIIKDFSKKNENAVILLDGIHYYLTKNSFKDFINTLYQINEIVIKHKAMMFVRFDPNILLKDQYAILENELEALPSQKIKGITLEDSVYEILKFIYQQNKNNALVPFKKVMSKFKISYSTAAKRLEGLENKGLVYTKRQGKLRTIYISEKGKTLLHKREVAE